MSRCKFDWAAVRRVWAREGLSARETAARFGAGYSTVTGRIRQEGWRRDAAAGNEAGDRPAAGEAAAAPCAAACTDPAGEGTGPAAATIAAANAGGGAPDRAGAGASLPASASGAADTQRADAGSSDGGASAGGEGPETGLAANAAVNPGTIGGALPGIDDTAVRGNGTTPPMTDGGASKTPAAAGATGHSGTGAGASLPASAPGASDSAAPVSDLHAAVERVTAAVLAAMERREGEETDLRTAREMTAVLKELANLSRATEPAEPAAEMADTVRVILAPELEEWGG